MNYRYLVENEDTAPPGEWLACFGPQFIGQPDAYLWFSGVLPGLTGTRDPKAQRREMVKALERVRPTLPPAPDVTASARQRAAEADRQCNERLAALKAAPPPLPTPARPAWINPAPVPPVRHDSRRFWREQIPRSQHRDAVSKTPVC